MEMSMFDWMNTPRFGNYFGRDPGDETKLDTKQSVLPEGFGRFPGDPIDQYPPEVTANAMAREFPEDYDPDYFPVLDKGFVRLDAALADDWSVVNAARVSLHNHFIFHVTTELGDKEKGLINFLMKNRHGTPFEHNIFRFHIKCPLFVAREWQRHRIGSFNEWSGRYSEMKPDFYLPETLRTQKGNPGAYTFEEMTDPEGDIPIYSAMIQSYDKAWNSYQFMLDQGVAKELARIVLPLALYTEFYWSINARSLMNFLSLRNSDQAMFEIRSYASAVETLFETRMPVTAASFLANGRQSP